MKKALFSFGLMAMMLLSVRGFAQTTFTKVTSASGLEAGANYLIVAHSDDLGALAMGYQKASNRQAVVVSEDAESITTALGTDANSETDVFQFTLVGAVAGCIQVTTFHLVEQGPSAIAATQGELEHIRFTVGIRARDDRNGFAVFRHDHSLTVGGLLVTHGQDTHVVAMGHDEVVGSGLET